MVFYRSTAPKKKKMTTFIGAGLFTPRQISEILQLNILTVYSYIKEGQLSAIKLGRSYRITKEDLDDFLRNHRTSEGRKDK